MNTNTMPGPWKGLHNRGAHDVGDNGTAWCTVCDNNEELDDSCTQQRPCRCCLTTEIETLQALRIKNAGLAADNILLRAQVQKVQEQIEQSLDNRMTYVTIEQLLEALGEE